VDIVGPTLPALKLLITLPAGQKPSLAFARVIHGMLSACLLNVDDMKYVLFALKPMTSLIPS
jgi:hypothetical protein